MLGNIIRMAFPQKQGTMPESTSMTYKLEKDFPDKIIAKNEINHAVIGRKGNQTLYSIFCPDISADDEKAMAQAKALAVNSLVNGKDITYSKESMGLVAGILKNILSNTSTSESKELLLYLVANDIAGYGPISVLLDDSTNIEEIVVNSPTGRIGIYHSIYGYCTTNMHFATEADFRFIVNKLISATERELNDSNPVIDAEIEYGSRLHAQIKPYAVSGAAASIRIGGKKNIDIKRLMLLNTATPEILAYLWLAMDARCNIIISGAPSSGKTTLLVSLSALLPRSERIVTIEEDANEIKYFGNFTNVVQLQGSKKSAVTTKDQIINALHLRPDRLILGEIRGSEASEVFAGSNIGIPFMTTMHSSGNGSYIISRLGAKPMSVDESLVSMLDITVFMKQSSFNTRVIDSIDEYKWLSRNEISAEAGELYTVDEIAKSNTLNSKSIGASKVIERYANMHGIKTGSAVKELKNREAFLSAMKNSNEDAYEYIEKYGAT